MFVGVPDMLGVTSAAVKYKLPANPLIGSIVELRQLRHFLALAEVRNFSRAATELHIAQPALSISIRKLEEEIGTDLFERGPRGVKLTEAGRVALVSARNALSHVEEVGRLASAVAAGDVGLLRIAFVGGATFRILPRQLPEFRRRYPQVQLELTESTTLEIIEHVQSGVIDAGIIRHPLISAAGLAVDVLEKETLVAVLPRGHRLASQTRLFLRDLAEEPFIQFSRLRAPSLNAIISLACQDAGFEPLVSQEALQIQTIVSLVESGLGVALVPGSCQAASGQAVEFRPLTDRRKMLTVGLALVSKRSNGQRLVQNFIDVMREV